MKRIRRFVLLIILMLTCTGCTIEYNIDITEDTIEEVLNVTDYITSNRTSQDILKHYNTWYPTYVNFLENKESIEIEDFSQKVDGIEYHNKSIKETYDGYSYTYSYKYPIDKYYDAYVLANTFLETTVHQGNNTLVIKTDKKNLLCQYDYFDSIKVNITIDPNIYTINYTNSQNIKNNTYSWTLDKSNCNNSQIILTLDKIQKDNEIIDNPSNIQKNNNNDYTMYIFFGILILLILIGYFIYTRFKQKNENFDIDD